MGHKITENPKVAGAKNANQGSPAGWMLPSGPLGLAFCLAKIAEGVTPSADDQNMLFDLQFDHILIELSEINKTADDVVQSNIEALGAISASGVRIDRLSRDNEHSLARLVTGSVA